MAIRTPKEHYIIRDLTGNDPINHHAWTHDEAEELCHRYNQRRPLGRYTITKPCYSF